MEKLSLDSISSTWLMRFFREYVFIHIPFTLLYWGLEARARLFTGVSDANPLDLIWVNPEEITYRHNDPPKGLGKVLAGDWDLHREPFEREVIHEFIRNCIEGDLPKEESELYRQLHELLKRGEQPRGCHSEAELRELLDKIESLYSQIDSNGYRSQQSLLASTPKLADQLRSSKNRDTFHPVFDEIAVNIHRDGEIAQLRSGSHRVTIAKHLNIP